MYAIETEGLTKYYGQKRGIIDLNLKINEGEQTMNLFSKPKYRIFRSIAKASIVTLGNNVVIKFTNGSNLSLWDDISNLGNYNGSGVYFTSFRDDNLKGDTNGDGSATSPADNDWDGIYNNNIAVSAYMTWTNILYDSY